MGKKESTLPIGISYRENKDLFMWRFKHQGVTFSGYSKTLADAKKELRNKRYEVEHGTYHKEKHVTLDTWFNEWIDVYKVPVCKESTLNFYLQVYKRYISPVFGKKKIKDIKPEQIQKFVNGMAKAYSEATAGTCNFLLYDCLRQAAANEAIVKNPMTNTTVPKFKKPEKKKALPQQQVFDFLEYTQKIDCSYYSVFRTLTLSGLRIGECLGLTWDDVDFDNEELHVRRTLVYFPKKGFYLDRPKSDAGLRDIPMKKGGELYNLLKKRRIEQFEQRTKAENVWQPMAGLENLVFTTKVGTPHHDTNIRKMMKAIIKEMQGKGYDIPEFTPHTFRHSFATRCLENGMNPKTLQVILGHSTFAITMDLYVDVMKDTCREEMAMVAEAL